MSLSILHINHLEARDGLFLALGALSPFILRSFGDWIISLILDKCCKMTKKEFRKHLIGTGDSITTIGKIWDKSVTFRSAKLHLGINTCAAITICMIRLLFWHWMQPILYGYVLFAYWDLLDYYQQILGLIVGGREGIYFILTLLALYRQPIYLLVDLRSSWKENRLYVLVYIFAPEKYVFRCYMVPQIVGNQMGPMGTQLIVLAILPILCVMDIAGIAAFIRAFVVNNVYVPMIVGYTITSIGVIVMTAIYCRSSSGFFWNYIMGKMPHQMGIIQIEENEEIDEWKEEEQQNMNNNLNEDECKYEKNEIGVKEFIMDLKLTNQEQIIEAFGNQGVAFDNLNLLKALDHEALKDFGIDK